MSEEMINYLADRVGKLEMQVHYLEEAAQKDTILVKRRKLHEDAVYPFQAHKGDAGWDVCCLEDFELPSFVPVKVKTGLSLQPQEHFSVTIRDRSGWGSKGIHVLAGLCEYTYTGEYIVCLINLNANSKVKFEKGTKIAQLVFSRVPEVFWSDGEFEETERSDKGFGSSDLKKG